MEKQKDYLDKLVRSLMKEGKDINEVLNMPYHFVLDLLEEQNKPQRGNSFFELI
ncbi:hypothetical protein ABEP17_15685 [Priestia flexa]|uniref:Uncharacterized protein n=1 Tax=Priestia flexa TaxID=86664 RepID=A0ABU4J490_9BACI|nr:MULTISPECIES: hypothetical protein [Bacillaceae]MCG7314148.1 hypothetical protein [Priestia flexa]MCM3068051.1 hypothetical protein [Priestia flexa]MDW8515817.1 hypothetical protein [Priestia flexa]MED4589419.1 hypothetical protein [Priestia flexa]